MSLCPIHTAKWIDSFFGVKQTTIGIQAISISFWPMISRFLLKEIVFYSSFLAIRNLKHMLYSREKTHCFILAGQRPVGMEMIKDIRSNSVSFVTLLSEHICVMVKEWAVLHIVTYGLYCKNRMLMEKWTQSTANMRGPQICLTLKESWFLCLPTQDLLYTTYIGI